MYLISVFDLESDDVGRLCTSTNWLDIQAYPDTDTLMSYDS